MTAHRRKGAVPKEEGAHRQEGTLRNNQDTSNVPPADLTRKVVSLLCMEAFSPVAASTLLSYARIFGPLPATAERRHRRRVVMFFAVPDEARCDFQGELGAGLELDVVRRSAAWANILGPVAAAPEWLLRLVMPRGAR